MTSAIRVVGSSKKSLDRPSHWVNDQGTAFRNPWESWREHDWRDQLYIMFQHHTKVPSTPKNMSELIPVRKPTWIHDGEDALKLKATWMGHATFYLEFPTRGPIGSKPSRGARILFDPIFSQRCSPIQWAGPKRITPPACSIDELPEIDAVVISHDHYDHLDQTSIRKLASLPRTPHFFAPLGNLSLLTSMGVPLDHCHILDWWDSRRIEVQVPSKDDKTSMVTLNVELTCTPNQHNVGRYYMDRFYDPKSLWSSWVAREITSHSQAKSAYFVGDTGYRAVLDGQDEDQLPFCTAFREIGEKFDGFDLAMIPIGAYMPRRFMSPVHCSPKESALLFKDVKAKHGLGMHWGTFVLSAEPVMEPPAKLEEACKELGIEEGTFVCSDIGETRLY